MEHFGKHSFEPVWRPYRHVLRSGVPDRLWPWLLDASSLTRRLIQSCAGQTFSVQVLSQGWERPMLSEARALGMRQATWAIVRQVHLLCGDTPWVFARTVIPVKTLTGAQRHLACLGNKPLGAVLFADPSMQRGGVELARINRGQRLFTRATQTLEQQPASIWGRRSVFYLSAKPLLVNEVFLPGVGEWGGQR